ncbi:MAG: glucose 1-dehydrogenase [Synergistaceae bacterium]|jgi:gluconate 5-dehydrogenase|nr:glucose 1-dehydrogenase [Synergistaceae bacterium]
MVNGGSVAGEGGFASRFSLEGEVALVTGGATGIGFGIAKSMTEAGAKVVISGRREELLKKAVEELGKSAAYVTGDVTSAGESGSFAERVTKQWGPVSILVNNAGNHHKQFFLDTALEDFEKVLNTHLKGSFLMTKAFAPGMVERGHGSVLFIASMATFMGLTQVAGYAAAKSAIGGMVRVLAAEFGEKGVRVNAIAPGWIHSELMHKAVNDDPPRKAKILGRTPMNRFGDPSDIGDAAVYLSSPAASFVTGVILPVDGGAVIGF